MFSFNVFSRKDLTEHSLPNRWDLVAFGLLLALLLLLGWGGKAMSTPYQLGQHIPITLDPSMLPAYAWRSTLRMVLGMLISLIFTGVIGTMAAHSRRAERILIPLIDILQSVPVLGFLSISVWGFIKLFPNSLLGPECAAIFAIFTSQVWNMTLSMYQSLKTIPGDLRNACRMLDLSPWRIFWRLEVPYAVPGLLWNSMLSMSTGWFFVVASEAIDIAHQHILLPGVGSYIAVAVQRADTRAITYAIATMMIVIVLFDQVVFQPLSVWASRFQRHDAAMISPDESWFIRLFCRTRWMRLVGSCFGHLASWVIEWPIGTRQTQTHKQRRHRASSSYQVALGAVVLALCYGLYTLHPHWTWQGFLKTVLYGAATSLRIAILIALCVLVWTPIGVWIGQRPKLALRLQPVIQFLASFPANLLFPVVIYVIVHHQLNVDIWTSPLIILGTQWYILFNVIAGTLAIPKNMIQAMSTLNLKRKQWWQKMILPAIAPYLITGMISAAGGAWNASILAEAVNWGDHTFLATGLGAFIAQATQKGQFDDLALGIIVMCVYVLLFNHFLWQPLYERAAERYTMPHL